MKRGEYPNRIIYTLLFIHLKGALARVGAYFGMGNGPILLADVFCSGNEASLLDCNRNTFGVLTCNHFNDAGVTCESKFIMHMHYPKCH